MTFKGIHVLISHLPSRTLYNYKPYPNSQLHTTVSPTFTTMGNTLGGKKTVKIMKITGETFKLKTPVKAGEVVKDYPGLVLLESEAVKHYGIRAKPLQPNQDLVPKRLYFLVELPKSPTEKVARRVRSGPINMSAKDRLESLMLARRSASDLSIIKNTSSSSFVSDETEKNGHEESAVRVKMRLPKAEVEKLMKESKNEAEVAEKIMNLYVGNKEKKSNDQTKLSKTSVNGRVTNEESVKKRVSFLPVNEGEMQIAVASY